MCDIPDVQTGCWSVGSIGADIKTRTQPARYYCVQHASDGGLKRLVSITVKAGVWALTGLVLFMTFAIGRLMVSPVDLAFARDTILAQAAAAAPGWTLDFQGARIGWDWYDVRPWIHLEQVTVRPPAPVLGDVSATGGENGAVLRVPALRLGLTYRTLFGEIDFSRLQLDGLAVDVPERVWRPLVVPSGERGDTRFEPERMALFVQGLEEVLARGRSGLPGLRHVELRGARLTLLGREPGLDIDPGDGADKDILLSLPVFRLDIYGGDAAVTTQLDLALGTVPLGLRMDARYDGETRNLELSGAVTDLVPADLPALHSEIVLPDVLNYLHLPVALDIEALLTATGGLRRARFGIDIGEGVLSHPVAYPKPAPIRYGTAVASFEADSAELRLEQLELALQSAVIQSDGLLYWEKGKTAPGVNMAGTVGRMTIPELLTYWPIRRHPDGRERGARAWVFQQMLDGEVTNARFAINADTDGQGAFEQGSPFLVTFDFDHIDSYFVTTMPPLYEAVGSGRMTRKTMQMDIRSAMVEGLPVGRSSALLTDLDVRQESYGTFNVTLKSEIAQMLSGLNHHPVRMLDKVNISLDRLRGQAETQAEIGMYLGRTAENADVRYNIAAVLHDLEVDDILEGEGLRSGEIVMRLDNDTLVAEGVGTVNSVPLNLLWRETFKPDAGGWKSDLSAWGRATAAQLENLKVPVTEYAVGPLYVRGRFLGDGVNFHEGTFSADLTDSALRIRELAWAKPAGQVVQTHGRLHFRDEATYIDAMTVTGDDIDAHLDIVAYKDGTVMADTVFSRLGSNTFKARIARAAPLFPSGGEAVFPPWQVNVMADTLDIRPFLEEPTAAMAAFDVLAAERAALADIKAPSDEDADLAISTDRLILLNGESLSGLSLAARFRDGEPKEVDLTARHMESGLPMSLSIVEQGGAEDRDDAGQLFSLASADGGAFLRAMGYFAHMRGGTLAAYGTTRGWGDGLSLKGIANSDTATIFRQSAFSDDVTVGIMPGLDNYVNEDGLLMSTFNATLAYENGLIDFDKFQANGPRIGMTMEGEVGVRVGKVNVNGVIVPAYGLNSLFGRIPIIGTLLSGGKGKGLIGFAYRVKGTLDEPTVSVNPLSGLAPGFLRGIFEGSKGKVADVETPVPEPDEDTPAEPSPQQPPAGGQNIGGQGGDTRPRTGPSQGIGDSPEDTEEAGMKTAGKNGTGPLPTPAP